MFNITLRELCNAKNAAIAAGEKKAVKSLCAREICAEAVHVFYQVYGVLFANIIDYQSHESRLN